MTSQMLFLFLFWMPTTVQSSAKNKTLRIKALLPMGNNSRWLVKNADIACRLAVEHVNSQPSLLDAYNLELDTNSSDCDVGLANYQLYEMLSARQKSVALIAEGCAIVTQPLAKTTQHFNILQFNFLSSSPSLYNRTVYPLYYPLLPAETTLNYARLKLLEELNWRDVIILIETEEVFSLVANHLTALLTEQGYDYELHIVSADMPSTVDVAIENIATSDRRIIIGLFYEEVGRHLVCHAFRKNVRSPNYVWLFPGWFSSGQSSHWYTKKGETGCSNEEMRATVDGHFKFDFSQSANDSSVRLPTGKTRRDVELEYGRITGTNAFEQYSAYGYDVVVSIALMLNETINTLKADGRLAELDDFSYQNKNLRRLFQHLLETRVDFDGLTGRIHFCGDTCNHTYLERRRRKATERIRIEYCSENTKSFFVAVYDKSSNALLPDNVQNIPWINGKIPVAKIEDVLDYSGRKLFYVISVLAGLGIVLALSMLAFNVHFRSRKVVKMSSPHLNNVVAIGAVLVYASIVFDGFNGQFYPLNNWSMISCYVRNCLLAIGFSLSFGSMFAKTWRVSRIVKESNAGRTGSLHLTNAVLLGVVGVFVLIDVLLLSLWYGINPFRSGTENIGTSEDARYIRKFCSTAPGGGHWLYILCAYKGLILVLGVYLAYDTRHVRIVSLNDSRYIAMSVYNTVISCIVVFALSFVPNPGLRYALTSAAIIIAVVSVLGCVFVPKIYSLITDGDKKIETFGRVGTLSSGIGGSIIARTTDLLTLQSSEKRKESAIHLLIRHGTFSEATIRRVKSVLRDDYDAIFCTSSSSSLTIEKKHSGDNDGK